MHKKKFENTKSVNRSRKSQEGQTILMQWPNETTNNVPQNTTQKTRIKRQEIHYKRVRSSSSIRGVNISLIVLHHICMSAPNKDIYIP
jgi:hypothetical protein